MSVETDTDAISDEEREEILQEVERQRSLRGPAAIAVALVGLAFSAFQMWLAARGFTFEIPIPFGEPYRLGQLQKLQLNAIHVSFALVIAFLLFPPTRGDGPVARRLGRLEPVARDRFGTDHVLTRVVERLGDGVRWFAVDREMERVTPFDLVLIVLSVVPTTYIVTEFDEVRETAVFGLASVRPIQEVYPVLEPLVSVVAAVGVPLDEISYAFLLGIVGVLVVLEATRRALGLLLTSLIAAFLAYARWGYVIPADSPIGALAIPPSGWDSIVRNMWYTTETGVFGTPVDVSVRFIYIFILFGAFLEMSGAGKWFIDLAYSLTGTRKGGPAKASVVSSGFMGMLSGSSIANTVTTGAFTIPLMKRSGYSREFSGAVEASASSGGQILPPVMGAAAFLIVELTGTPYPDVITAAALPAIAFFFGMWVMVHFEAARGGIGGLSRSELPDVRSHFLQGWFYLLPLVLLLYFLIGLRLSINRAGWYTIVTIVALIAVIAAYDERNRVPLLGTIGVLALAQLGAYATYGVGLVDALGVLAGIDAGGDPLSLGAAATAAVSDLGTIAILVSVAFVLARPNRDAPLLELDDAVDESAANGAAALGRPDLADNTAFQFGSFILKSMASGARTATTVVIAVAAAGIIPGVISVSGLGPNLTQLITTISGDSMLLLMILAGVAAIIFGMGMPTTVMYIILVAMLGPALESLGVVVLAAHLYILYFGLMADVTPPVAVAAFAAAGVAKADEFGTAAIAFLLSLNKILVPFAFVFSPGILLIQPTENGFDMVGLAELTDLGYAVPEVLIPIVGMFLGIYTLGIAIIGYQYATVDGLERVLFSLSSIFLMVPDIPLRILEGALGLAGAELGLTAFVFTVSLRAVGLALLAGLTSRNRRQSPKAETEEATTVAPGDA